MKLRRRAENPELPSEATLFEPWERLLLVSMELDAIEVPAMRELAAACFACIRHMAGRSTRTEAYRAVRRALDAARELAGPRQTMILPDPVSVFASSPIQHRLPVEDGMTIRVSREAHEVLTAYARERGLDFEAGVERLIRTARRRRAAVQKYNRKAKGAGASS